MNMQRREFITSAALTAAVSMLPQNNFSQSSSQLKKAVLISMLPKNMSYFDRFQLAIDCGFEGLEAQTITDQKEAEQIKEAADKAKLRIHSVMNMAHWANPLSSSDPAKVAASMKGMETSLRNAKLWGADTVLLVPAVVDPTTTIPQAWERSVPQIKKLIPLAKELNVVIAIEEVWNKFLLTPYDLNK
jgi:L-ribulose-5-phosphate 3-epimerase